MIASSRSLASSPENPPRAIYEAFVEANQSVVATSLTRGVEGMGTTGVICWVLEGRCYVGWVGDSRLYQFRACALIDRTRDHTRVAQMVSHGILTPEEARHHPDAHVLVQALGGSPGVQKSFKPEVWTEPLELKSGDVVLLCSDGLYDFIEDHELYPLIEGRDYQDAVARLIQLANERGGADNITVILLVAGQPEVPRTVTEPQERRRETVPDGLPLVPVVAPQTPAPEASARAVPENRAAKVEPPAPSPVFQTSAPRGSGAGLPCGCCWRRAWWHWAWASPWGSGPRAVALPLRLPRRIPHRPPPGDSRLPPERSDEPRAPGAARRVAAARHVRPGASRGDLLCRRLRGHSTGGGGRVRGMPAVLAMHSKWHYHFWVTNGRECFVYDEEDDTCNTTFLRRNQGTYWRADPHECARLFGERHGANMLVAHVIDGKPVTPPPPPPPMQLDARVERISPGPYTAGDKVTVVGAVRDEQGALRRITGGTFRVTDANSHTARGTVQPDGTVSAGFSLPTSSSLRIEFVPVAPPLAQTSNSVRRPPSPRT